MMPDDHRSGPRLAFEMVDRRRAGPRAIRGRCRRSTRGRTPTRTVGAGRWGADRSRPRRRGASPGTVSRRRADAGGGRRRRPADSTRACGPRPRRGSPSGRPWATACRTPPIPHSAGTGRTWEGPRRDRRSTSTKARCIPLDDRRRGPVPRGPRPAPARPRGPRGSAGFRARSATPAGFRRPGGSRPGRPPARTRTPPGAPGRLRRSCCACGSRGGNRARGDLGRRRIRASRARSGTPLRLDDV